jgi:hypothetical protein
MIVPDMSLSANLEHLQEELPHSAKLVVVTKKRTPEEIEEVLKAGASIIAENRIQEAKEKFPNIKSNIPHERHLIGHLQTNKVKDAVRLFDMIQSVDSLKLAHKINEEAEKQSKTMPILVQVNVSEDPDKYGFASDELPTVLEEIKSLSHLNIKGLMTIVKFHENAEDTRPYFKQMKQLADKFNLTELSMGMSHDHQIALEEGATMVRIGRAVFEGL